MQGQFLLAIDAALAASKPPESRVYTHVEPSKTDADSWIDVWLSREFEEPEGE
jgi:hypothetical protein